jgi:hypothetical protein
MESQMNDTSKTKNRRKITLTRYGEISVLRSNRCNRYMQSSVDRENGSSLCGNRRLNDQYTGKRPERGKIGTSVQK